MPLQNDIISLTSKQYELEVPAILDASGLPMRSKHQTTMKRSSVLKAARHRGHRALFSADFLVLVVCQHARRQVERQAVRAPEANLVSTGARKGMLFSVAGFQAGAIEYASVHGIALVKMAKGSESRFKKISGTAAAPPTWQTFLNTLKWKIHFQKLNW